MQPNTHAHLHHTHTQITNYKNENPKTTLFTLIWREYVYLKLISICCESFYKNKQTKTSVNNIKQMTSNLINNKNIWIDHLDLYNITQYKRQMKINKYSNVIFLYIRSIIVVFLYKKKLYNLQNIYTHIHYILNTCNANRHKNKLYEDNKITHKCNTKHIKHTK